MPLQLADLFRDTLTTRVEFNAGDIDVVWAPARYTGEMADLVETLNDEESATLVRVAELEADDKADQAARLVVRANRQTARNVARLLSQLIVSWDLMDGKKPHPTDVAGLAKLPDMVLLAVFTSLSQANELDPPKAASSNGTSAQAVNSARSPRGTRSSARRTTSASRRGK